VAVETVVRVSVNKTWSSICHSQAVTPVCRKHVCTLIVTVSIICGK